MTTKKTSQDGKQAPAKQAPAKQALMTRLMMALRRSSAAGVLHGQTIARRVGINSTDLECLDLILMSGPSTAGDIARHTGLTSGAVTGLIDRLERLELVERVADPNDRRKIRVKVRDDKIAPIGALYTPLEKAMLALLAGYSRDELGVLLDFAERSGDVMLRRVGELNSDK